MRAHDLPRAGASVPAILDLGIDSAKPATPPVGLRYDDGSGLRHADGFVPDLVGAPLPTERLVAADGLARGADGFSYLWELTTEAHAREDLEDDPPVLGHVGPLPPCALRAVVRRRCGFTVTWLPVADFDLTTIDALRDLPADDRSLVFTRESLRHEDFLDVGGLVVFGDHDWLTEARVLGVGRSADDLRVLLEVELPAGHPDHRPPPPGATRRRRREHRSPARAELVFPGVRAVTGDVPGGAGVCRLDGLTWDGGGFVLAAAPGAMRIDGDGVPELRLVS